MLWAQWTQASLFLHSRTCMDSEFSSRLSSSLEFLASLNYSLMSKGTNAHSHYPELEGTRSPKARSCTFAGSLPALPQLCTNTSGYTQELHCCTQAGTRVQQKTARAPPPPLHSGTSGLDEAGHTGKPCLSILLCPSPPRGYSSAT